MPADLLGLALRGRRAGEHRHAWRGVPAAAADLALIVQDPDVPLGASATHALALIDPPVSGVAEDELRDPRPISGVRVGKGRTATARLRGAHAATFARHVEERVRHGQPTRRS